MLHDWSSTTAKAEFAEPAAAEAFPFWSRSEMTRVGLIVALAALPLSLATFEHPSATAKVADLRPAATIQTGQLRAVRIVEFNLKNLTPSALADLD